MPPTLTDSMTDTLPALLTAPDPRLKGSSSQSRVALVTGAAKRLGRAVALRLAEDGADLVIHYRSSQKEAYATAQEVESLGRRALTIPADLTQVADIQNLFEQTARHFGRLDILIN